MHIEDWNDEFLSQFDPQTYVENLKRGHINAPMLYLQSHVGLCYWPTRSGRMHRAFLGCEDKMKRLERLCHQNGMAVIAYYSLIYNNWAHEKSPGLAHRRFGGAGYPLRWRALWAMLPKQHGIPRFHRNADSRIVRVL